jgi:hypothetical protein
MKTRVIKQMDKNTKAMKTVRAILKTKLTLRYNLPISEGDFDMLVVDIIVATDGVKLLKMKDLED